MAKSLQLVTGRTGQEYNQRKGRLGAFWQDRYHATAVDTDKYLARRLVYIDLNMVRAGAVRHPSERGSGGYREIQNPPKRYRLIDQDALREAAPAYAVDFDADNALLSLDLAALGEQEVSEAGGCVGPTLS
jgi:putative transposase